MESVSWGLVFSFAGAAIAAFASGTGSAIGVGKAGEALSGLVSEDPDKFGRGLVLQLLPGTQGIYGLVVAFMIMNNVGLFLPTFNEVTVTQGLIYFFGAMPIALVGLLSAIAQGKTVVTGIMLLAKREEEMGKAIVMAVMVETYAVLALLVSMLVVLTLKIG